MVLDRFDPPAVGVDDLVDQLLYEHVEYLECYPGVLTGLERLNDAGVPLVIVTNDGNHWMVGDHIETDIAGARAAGCSTAWVSHTDNEPRNGSPH